MPPEQVHTSRSDRPARSGPVRQDRALLPTLHPIVVVHIARSPQSLVVQRSSANGIAQLFAELMDRPQVLRHRRNLHLARLNKLLVSAIQQTRDLAIQQPA